MLFDTHAHFDDPQFDSDRDEVIKSLADDGELWQKTILR